jgi:hypothetical protein
MYEFSRSQGQKRRIEAVGDESGLPPIAAVPLHCGEPTFRANSRPEHLQQRLYTDANYSITSSAREINAGEMVTPIVFAVFRLKTNSNSVGCSTGRSAGLAPLRILST